MNLGDTRQGVESLPYLENSGLLYRIYEQPMSLCLTHYKCQYLLNHFHYCSIFSSEGNADSYIYAKKGRLVPSSEDL